MQEFIHAHILLCNILVYYIQNVHSVTLIEFHYINSILFH